MHAKMWYSLRVCKPVFFLQEGGDAGRSGVDPEEYVNYTDVEVKFEIKEVGSNCQYFI